MNELIGSALGDDEPMSLFGELWLEGEMALLFGEVGVGKSVLATQIAESLARSWQLGPLERTAGPRRVLYVDLEMSRKQVQMRYSDDGRTDGKLGEHYAFSEDVKWISFDPYEAMAEANAEETARSLCSGIEREVRKHDIDVVILDSLTALKRSYYGSTELSPVMRRLRRLISDCDVSVLVIADVARADRPRALTLNCLGGLRLAANIADSIFALGQSGEAADERYLKHLRSRSTDIIFNSAHLPTFALIKDERAFLGFEFIQYENERTLMTDIRLEAEDELTVRIYREIKEKGRSIRDVAEEVGKSKSTVHRLYKSLVPLPGQEGYEEADEAEQRSSSSADGEPKTGLPPLSQSGANGHDNGIGVEARTGPVGMADGRDRAPP
ncbi:MAG: AAA family ATPase [Chloracidobacterium sp.]|nr:AAA family ATPase [Chloracidobacterium sp.]